MVRVRLTVLAAMLRAIKLRRAESKDDNEKGNEKEKGVSCIWRADQPHATVGPD